VAGSAAALAGLIGRHVRSRYLIVLGSIVALALLSVWITAFQTFGYQGRYAYVGLTAMAALAALGLERWQLPVRFILPAAGLLGVLVALQTDVLAVHWT
jgi:hypothetical protein